MVSNNGTPFPGTLFTEFITQNRIGHLRTARNYPQPNRLPKRAVRTIKDSLKKLSGGSLAAYLARWLLVYRCTPLTTGGQSPTELVFNFCLRVRCMDLITETQEPKVDLERPSNLKESNPVFEKQHGSCRTMGTFQAVENCVTLVKIHHGTMKHHLDQLCPRRFNATHT